MATQFATPRCCRCNCPALIEAFQAENETTRYSFIKPLDLGPAAKTIAGIFGVTKSVMPAWTGVCDAYDPWTFTHVPEKAYRQLLESSFFFARKVAPGAVEDSVARAVFALEIDEIDE